ncbi:MULTISPECIES: ATP-binding cassette domain-containing protein [unclassified Pedobacter]|uniref:ATP-binding cassette domain-containing protein n=1 Tax=unclassified Pedobacter TaxID=2628915 RepID=UPI001DF587CC|nr:MULTISPECIES: ATP-binding cassette domain-containing protein [unclassified Pedobacter]CAH0254238.1 Ribosome-associated ATPase [Pedobacter sp. Bi36]CAH0278763.1 Ribosome-associated ATPase [Pedobacter sp. Bi126]
MLKPFVYIQNLNLSYRNKAVLKDLYWEVNVCQNWVLWGESGSGKTSLAKAIAGLIPSQGSIEINYDAQSKLPAEVLFVESWYQFKNLEGIANFYYQQRYTSLQANDTLTVHAELVAYGKEKGLHFDLVEPILEALGFATFASSQLIELSSGEHKKLQLVKALWLKPQLLIIDQPYTGLDKASRKNLNVLLDQITAEGVQLILICNDLEFPESIDSFAEIIDGQIVSSFSREIGDLPPEIHKRKIPAFLKESPIYSSTDMVKMVDVNISYGEKQVLKNINWEVKAGEKWLLQGPNGSGKSTLLSLINGDHPQSYANELYLFGNRRGTGESIWDIKQHIGLISPEFHWYFDATSTVWKCIASGFYDTVGLFQQLPYSKRAQVDELIEYFGLTDNKNELLTALPLGKQRLVLLARTIIKNPELLILDEPCQGLDQQQTRHFNQLVDELCSNGMTLIYVGHFESQLPTCIEKRILLEKGEVKVVESLNTEILS